jgi:hypothetical protein
VQQVNDAANLDEGLAVIVRQVKEAAIKPRDSAGKRLFIDPGQESVEKWH